MRFYLFFLLSPVDPVLGPVSRGDVGEGGVRRVLLAQQQYLHQSCLLTAQGREDVRLLLLGNIKCISLCICHCRFGPSCRSASQLPQAGQTHLLISFSRFLFPLSSFMVCILAKLPQVICGMKQGI